MKKVFILVVTLFFFAVMISCGSSSKNAVGTDVSNTPSPTVETATPDPTPEPTAEPTKSPHILKQEALPVSGESLLRDPNSYICSNISVSGRIIQVVEVNYLLVDCDGVTCIVSIKDAENATYRGNPIENDQITIYGKSLGVTEYTTVLGASKQAPAIDCYLFSK